MDNIIIRENYLARIRPFYHSKYIKAITGVRRCGKSELLLQIIAEIKALGISEDHIIVFDLEGKSGEGLTTRKKIEKKLDKLIKDKEKYYKKLQNRPKNKNRNKLKKALDFFGTM